MKPIPEILQSELCCDPMFLSRPWWSRHPGYGYYRTDGTHLESASGQGWFVLYGCHRGDYGYDTMEAIRTIDQKFPLKKPPLRVGQIWGWESGDVRMITHKVEGLYYFAGGTTYSTLCQISGDAYLLHSIDKKFWSPV